MIRQEVSLLFSSTFPSFLLPALPCAFVAESHHYVPSATIRNTVPPLNVQITKIYFKSHVKDIKRRFEIVKENGSDSASQWIEGLEAEGQEKLQEIAKWEQWESKGGLRKVNAKQGVKIVSSGKQGSVIQPSKDTFPEPCHTPRLSQPSASGPIVPTFLPGACLSYQVDSGDFVDQYV